MILRHTLVLPEAVPPATPMMNGASRAPSWLTLIATSVESCLFIDGVSILYLPANVPRDLTEQLQAAARTGGHSR